MLPAVYIIILHLLLSASKAESRVCQSVDVRNSPDHIQEFKDCRVIEGYLKLVLMEPFLEDDFINKSFSELYEIRDYLMVYRVMGLTSLETVFPKLTSIRGDDLILGHALILYGLDDLRETGLKNLKHIERGSVIIQQCPNLCYVNTLNWTAIGASNITYDDNSTCQLEGCPNHCAGHCWNNYECQTLIKEHCHSSCIGCSQTNSPKHCDLCKYFNNSGTCVQTCPKSKLTDNYNSRCIYPAECLSRQGTWSIFNNTCVPRCPAWYERNSKSVCVPSEVNACPGIKITNIEDTRFLRGCTHIEQSLEIAADENYMPLGELEANLKNIISISGYLKIVRSLSLTSLNFFKSLKIIKGEHLWGSHHSLFIADNQNLQTLFNTNSTLVVEKGGAVFNNNPHLCPSEIKNINISSLELSAFSNGFEAVCGSIKDRQITIIDRNSTNITLFWEVFEDELIGGYTIYYREISSISDSNSLKIKNGFVTTDGISFRNEWNSVCVFNNTVTLNKLSPFTLYGYYIKSNFLSKRQNFQTPFAHFRTISDEPSEVSFLESDFQTDTSITLNWGPPRETNGILFHYKLEVYVHESSSQIPQRNYCLQPYREDLCSCSAQQLEPYENNVYKKREFPHKKMTGSGFRKWREFIINPRRRTFVVNQLQHFTLYTFFLQANNRNDNGDFLRGAVAMLSQRTRKKENADRVADFSFDVHDDSVTVSWEKPKQPNAAILAYNVEYRRKDSNFGKLECCTNEDFENEGGKFKIFDLAVGRYKIRVRAVSLAGPGNFTQWEDFDVVQKHN